MMANGWFKKSAGNGMEEIQEAFKGSWIARGAPQSMALFSKSIIEPSDVVMYFSPDSAPIAGVLGAIPCDKPSAEDIRLSCGVDNARDLFFPEDNDL
jgi:hypothetical protein